MNGWGLRLRLRASARVARIFPFDGERCCDRRSELLQHICASGGSRCREVLLLRNCHGVFANVVSVVCGRR